MLLVNNYILAILCCAYCCICWGSWANTQKMVAAKKWSFELFYWDLTIGLFLTATLAALTLGSLGHDGRTFFEDLAAMDWSSIRYALLGGIVWNFGNIFLTAAIAVAGMSIGFPVGGGLAWIGGIIFNYLLITLSGQAYPGNPFLLWTGVVIIIIAIFMCGKIYGNISAGKSSTPKKGIFLAVVAGLAIMFFYGLVVKSIDPLYIAGGTGTLSPYTGVFFFAVGILVSTPIFNTFAMKYPVQGEKVTMKDYFGGDIRTHLTGILGGLIWMSGMAISFMGAGAANPAIAYALSNASPVVAMIWGIFIWKEFSGASRGTVRLITAMFLLFIAGLVCVTLSVERVKTVTGTVKDDAGEASKPRVIVMTDGEVDDRCSMIRFLLHTNEVEVMAIIQTNSVFQGRGWSSEQWIEKQLDAYEQVHPNLIVHDPAYPSADELRKKLFIGDEDSTHLGVDRLASLRVPGMKPVIDPSEWPDTPGSDRIVEVLLEDDPRKVYIQAWGGGNTAARAFQKLKTRYPEAYERAVKKAVMYNIWYQDGAGHYIETFHPDVTMLVSFHFSGSWDYGSQRYTDGFAEKYLHRGHGPLAALYPQQYISEGDSPAFLYTLGNGLRGYEDPAWGGWGGQFFKVEGLRNVYRDVDRGSYQRWVEVANRDFEARLQWCVADKFQDANHRPLIHVRDGLAKEVKAGETVVLEAEVTDRDPLNIDMLWSEYSALYEQLGIDKDDFAEMASLRYPKYTSLWWQYKEAGTYKGYINLTAVDRNKAVFVAPQVDKPETLHLILEATDKGAPALTTFARVIVTVLPADKEK